jgi:hypothetical protein
MMVTLLNDPLSIVLQEPDLALQHGVLRTNCIDCLDRTNVTQFAYGLAALGRELQVLEITDSDTISPRSSLAAQLMDMYEQMGNVLSRQVKSVTLALLPCTNSACGCQ